MRTYITAGAAALLLLGCATPAEQAARAQQEVDQMMQVYGPACNRLGYAVNSDPWRNCVLQLSAKDDAERSYPHYSGRYGRPGWSLGGSWGRRW